MPAGDTTLDVEAGRTAAASAASSPAVAGRASGAFAITARDSNRPNDGQVVLAFAGNPMRLQEWTITDPQGARTRTQLTSLQPASGLSARLFQLSDPTRRPGRN